MRKRPTEQLTLRPERFRRGRLKEAAGGKLHETPANAQAEGGQTETEAK
jgi:hypothetical protein